MQKDREDMDIEQWILDYLNSDYDSKVKTILKDKNFVEEWFLAKKKSKKIGSVENQNGAEPSKFQQSIRTPDQLG